METAFEQPKPELWAVCPVFWPLALFSPYPDWILIWIADARSILLNILFVMLPSPPPHGTFYTTGNVSNLSLAFKVLSDVAQLSPRVPAKLDQFFLFMS